MKGINKPAHITRIVILHDILLRPLPNLLQIRDLIQKRTQVRRSPRHTPRHRRIRVPRVLPVRICVIHQILHMGMERLRLLKDLIRQLFKFMLSRDASSLGSLLERNVTMRARNSRTGMGCYSFGLAVLSYAKLFDGVIECLGMKCILVFGRSSFFDDYTQLSGFVLCNLL